MVLSDRDIEKELATGRLIVNPLADGNVQPASVDLRLGRNLRIFQRHRLQAIDVKQEMAHLTDPEEIDEVNPFFLQPGEFALGVTVEEIGLPNDIVGRLDGKSSLGRLGLVVHSTAGFVDPGWRGNLTLELSNLAPLPIALYYGMKISQISFMRLSSPAINPYGSKKLGSKYQGQTGPTPSRFFQDYLRTQSHSGAQPRGTDPSIALHDWLQSSEFKGSINLFATALEMNPRTVEAWVYGRSTPSRRSWAKLYQITNLSRFRLDGLDFSELES